MFERTRMKHGPKGALATTLFYFLIVGALFVTAFLVRINETTCSFTQLPKLETQTEGKARPPNNETKIQVASRASYNSPENGEWWNSFRCELKIGDAVIAYLTFCLVVVGGFQAWWMRQTLATSHEGERRELRAYVGMEEVKLILGRKTEQAIGLRKGDAGWISEDYFMIAIKNFGQTPGSDISMYVNWHTMDYPQRLPDNFKYPDYDVPAENDEVRPLTSYDFLDAKQVRTIGVIIKDAKDFHLAQKNRKSVYVYGHINYSDIYGVEWERTFCFAYLPGGGVPNSFIPYQEHNDERQTA